MKRRTMWTSLPARRERFAHFRCIFSWSDVFQRPASTKQTATAKKPRATSSRAKKSKAVIEEDEDDE